MTRDMSWRAEGEDLTKVADIDVGGSPCRVPGQVHCHVRCDQSLTGPDGATFTFGKQKGGIPEILDVLEGAE